MKKIYYLSTCNTCTRIMSEVNIDDSFDKQDIKTNPITEEEIDKLYEQTNSYEALFNKRARLIRERGLDLKTYTDKDYKKLILDNYTFLKRPVVILNKDIFIGNSKTTVEALKLAMNAK